MSRGRKPITTIYPSTWEQIFQKAQGYYFQYIISKLATNQNEFLSEDNANNILIQIKKKKEKLIKEKKIKQGKLQEAELQSELIFDIPKNWVWCKLDELCSNITDGTHQTPSYKESGRPFISAQHVKPFCFSPDKYKYVSEEAYHECIKSGKPERGDILVTRVGAIGEAAVIDIDMEFAYYVSVGLIKPFKEYIFPKFLAYIFNSPYGNLYSKGNVSSKGSSAGNFNLGRIRSFFVPLPPMSEQKMILDFLEDLGKNSIEDSKIYFDKVIENEIISIHKAQLLNNQTSNEIKYQLDLIKQLRQAFMREGMQGKLVKSTNTKETGQQLLTKIKAEKAKLIVEKKLKKEKELSPITDDEIPFVIPEHWTWCRLGEVCTKVTDGFHHTPKKLKEGYIYISPKHLKKNSINWSSCDYISEIDHNYLVKKTSPKRGEILIANRGTVGVPALIDTDEEFSFQNLALIGFNQLLLNNKFIFFYLIKSIDEIVEKFVNGGLQPMLSNIVLRTIPIPLPPLHEQEQIVAKLEDLMSFCDGLEESIKKSQGYNEMLLQQVLREALEPKEKTKVINIESRKIENPLKTILAGHIINLNNTTDFGRVKFQKLLFLTEYICKIDFDSHYIQKVAGPYDDVLIKGIEVDFNRMRFFNVVQDKTDYKRVRYIALAGAKELESLFLENFPDESVRINNTLLKFRPLSWGECELIATLYAVWNNRIIQNEPITDELLYSDFMAWDKQKSKYQSVFYKWLFWMKDERIIPDGWGKYIDKPQ
ncbi:MAG: restriction endonuclease subunit S [Bacteroidota bacterium]